MTPDLLTLSKELARTGRALIDSAGAATIGEHIECDKRFVAALEAYEAAELRLRPRYKVPVDDE